MTTQPARRRDVSLRTLLALTGSITFAFVAVVGTTLLFRIAPQARQMAVRSDLVRRDYEDRTRLGRSLDSARTEIGRMAADLAGAPPSPAAFAKSRKSIEQLITGAEIFRAAQRSMVDAPEAVAGLESADLAAEAYVGPLVGALAALELDDHAAAVALLVAADSLRPRLQLALENVTLQALNAVIADEDRLAASSRGGAQLIGIWLALGIAVLTVMAVILRERLFKPIAALDTALVRIEAGDLQHEWVHPRADELGRVAQHFNAATTALRSQRQLAARAAAEAARAQSEASYRAAFEGAAVGLAELDLQGRFQLVNHAAAEVFGRPRHALLGSNVLDFVASAPTLRAPWVGLIGLARSLVPTFGTDAECVRPDGTIASVHVSGTVLRDDEGAPRRILAVFHDVTEERRLQQRLLRTTKMEAVGQLAGGVAHDFNNLLTAVVGYAELLALDPRLPDEVRADATTIQSTAMRGADLARSLLTLARRAPVLTAPFDLSAALTELVAVLERTLDRRIVVKARFTQGLTAIGDRSLVSNALLNVALNARDAMPEGGTLDIEAGVLPADSPLLLRHDLAADGRTFVAVSIADTGPGIPPEVLERIFEPFFTTKDVGRGTGLGLAMVYSTVKDHNGAIDVESSPGQGARFTVLLPIAPDAAAQVLPGGQPIAAEAPARILVVDDEEVVRRVAVRLLTHLGYEVETVEDGQAALEFFAEGDREIRLALIDANMPRLDGFETARRLRRQFPELPMVLVTGYADPAGMFDVERFGFNDWLAKPYTFELLSKVVADYLRAGPGAAPGLER
ncbi:MAG: response regulator [Gemmatimonadales bacterium]